MLPKSWRVLAPHEDAVGPSGWPEEVDKKCFEAVRKFAPAHADETDAELEDMLNGHCEVVAAVLAERCLVELAKGASSSPQCQHDDAITTNTTTTTTAAATTTSISAAAVATTPTAAGREEEHYCHVKEAFYNAYATLVNELKSSDTADQVKIVLAPLAASRASSRGYTCRSDLWRTMPGQPACVSKHFDQQDHEFVGGGGPMCAGMPNVSQQIAELAKLATKRCVRLAVPLYVVNYIWDGSELSEEELARKDLETAQYSTHCIGLVFDGPGTSLLLADPNGPLMRGGSMEFVSLPPRALPPGIDPSTSLSRWDRKQADDAAVAAAAAKRKPKRKGSSRAKGGSRKRK